MSKTGAVQSLPKQVSLMTALRHYICTNRNNRNLSQDH